MKILILLSPAHFHMFQEDPLLLPMLYKPFPLPIPPPPPPPPHTHTHTHTYIGNLSSPDFIYLYGLRINDSRCQNTSSLLQITIILTFYQKIKREDLFYYET